MKILLVEDDEDKARKLLEFLQLEDAAANVIGARSLNSGLRAIIQNASDLDVLLLDMSMPNFDVGADEPTGGSPENYAGTEILAQMKLRGISIPTIVVSMFDSFGEQKNKISLENLDKRLMLEYKEFYLGHVYYSASQEGWQRSLSNLLGQLRRGDRE